MILESNMDKIHVNFDGSYELESHWMVSIKKEEGVEFLKLLRMQYDPNIEEKKVISAETINQGLVFPVHLSSIEDKQIASRGHGLSTRNQITVPFPALKVGSTISIKIMTKRKSPFLPGEFHFATVFGRTFFSKKDVAIIESEIPLFVKQRGANEYVSISQSRNGKKYNIKIELRRPISRQLIDEPAPALTVDMVPRVEVSSFPDWKPIAAAFAAKMDQALLEPLPSELQSIAVSASQKATEKEKVEHVISSLAETVKYLGDWREEKNYYLPRSLAEIAHTKQGDCKDYSFATVAILKQLGIEAKVAWVQRSTEQYLTNANGDLGSLEPLAPGLEHFNHAIVSAKINGQTFWLDPTNPIAHVGEPLADIANRNALILDAKTSQLSMIPAISKNSEFESTSYYAFLPSGRADVMASVEFAGSWASELKRQIANVPEEYKKAVMGRIAAPSAQLQYLGFPEEIAPGLTKSSKPREFNQVISYLADQEFQKTSLGRVFSVPAPSILGRFFIPHTGRVTGVLLGSPGIWEKKDILANFSLNGQKPKDCRAESKWGAVTRTFQLSSSSLVVTDKVDIKESKIDLTEMITPTYTDFQKAIRECFQETLLVFDYASPRTLGEKKPSMPNPILARQKSFADKGKEVTDSTSQQYENYTLSRLLLNEAVHEDPKNARAFGLLALSSISQGYSRRREYNQDALADGREFMNTALSMDPRQYNGHIAAITLAKIEGNHEKAEKLAREFIRIHPNETGPKQSLFAIQFERPATPEQRKQYANEAVKFGEVALPKASSGEKAHLIELLIDANSILQNHAEVAKYHEMNIANDPKSAWALLNYSAYLNGQQLFEKAEEYARKAIKVANVGMAHINLASALAGQAIIEFKNNTLSPRAFQFCSEALEHDPTNKGCLYWLGNYYSALAAKNGRDPRLVEMANKYRIAYRELSQGSGGINAMPAIRPAKKSVMPVHKDVQRSPASKVER